MMICTFEHQLYKNEGNGYTVARYMVRSAASGRSNMSSVFTAVGKELPCIAHAEIEMEGKWEESSKWGPQFRVSWFRLILPKTEDGIISYLSSDLMKGIGPVTARAIVKRFGVQTFDVLDKEPEKLLDIRGITQQKLSVILESYRQSEGIRELLACLAPFQVTPKKAEKIQAHFGSNAAAIVRENPYRLCEVKGFGFLTVDPIARASRQFKPNDPARIRAAIRYILREGEKEGNLFLPGTAIVEQAYPLLNQGFSEDFVTRPEIMRIGNEMAREKIELAADGVNIFLKGNRQEELYAAYHLVRLLKAETAKPDIEQPLELSFPKGKKMQSGWSFSPMFPSLPVDRARGKQRCCAWSWRYLNGLRAEKIFCCVRQPAGPENGFLKVPEHRRSLCIRRCT